MTLRQYREMKKDFFYKYSNVKAWGTMTSGNRIVAMDKLLDYFKETKKLIELDEDLVGQIYEDTVNILLGELIPVPRDLKQTMLRVYKPKKSFDDNFHDLLFGLKSDQKALRTTFDAFVRAGAIDSLMKGLPNDVDDEDSVYDNMSEANPVIEYDDQANFAAILKWFRWKSIRNTLTRSDVDKYEELVKKFVDKFNARHLTNWETSVWLTKIHETRNDVRNYRNNSESYEDVPEKVDVTKGKVESVYKFFDKAKVYESLCENLTSVVDVDDEEDSDQEIESRLLQLKFFNKIWLD